MEQERLKARRPSLVPQSWRHGWNWAQDNAVKRSVIVGQVGCEYNEIFCVFVSGCVQALNTWSPLCASFFLSFFLSLSLSGLLSPHTVRVRCATLSPGGSRGTGTAKIVELRPGLEDRGWEKRTVLKTQIETNHQRLLLSSRPAVVDGDGHMAVIDIAKCVSRRP